MLEIGQKIRLFGEEAVVLICNRNEVLVQIRDKYVKWIDMSVIDAFNPAKQFDDVHHLV